jgi:hypothetical protein
MRRAMMTHVSDATIILAATWLLIGWAAGFALAVSLFWRRITRPADGTVRLLRMQIDDNAAWLLRQQAIINELTVEVGQLHASSDRLTRRVVETSGERVA